VSNHVYLMTIRIFELQKCIHLVYLRRLINCLNVRSHTVWVVGIRRIVPVQVAHPLFNHTATLPEPNELRQLVLVHERHVINMTEDLPIQNDRRRNTLVAHSLWIWLVIFAIIIDLVADVLNKGTVLALCV
jgi:hypothetical protein